MRVERQFTTFLENKPGRLLNICSELAKEKVGIEALTVSESKDRSVLRFVVDKVDAARETLNRLGTCS